MFITRSKIYGYSKLKREDFEVDVEMEYTKIRMEILKREKVEIEGEVTEEFGGRRRERLPRR